MKKLFKLSKKSTLVINLATKLIHFLLIEFYFYLNTVKKKQKKQFEIP